MTKNKQNGYGITSLILGISSMFFAGIPLFGLISAILGIIFHVQQKKIFENGVSTAGLITSIIGLVLSILYFIAWISFIIVFSSAKTYTPIY